MFPTYRAIYYSTRLPLIWLKHKLRHRHLHHRSRLRAIPFPAIIYAVASFSAVITTDAFVCRMAVSATFGAALLRPLVMAKFCEAFFGRMVTKTTFLTRLTASSVRLGLILRLLSGHHCPAYVMSSLR